MKILWFTNTPCGASKKLYGKNLVSGGWLYSLSEEIKKKSTIDLHIAFYWGERINPFSFEGITYHPMYRSGDNSVWGRYIRRIKNAISHSIDDEDINKCSDLINDIDPDLIHIHGSEENFGLVAGCIRHKKILLSIQGLLNPCFDKLYSGFPESEFLKQESFLHKLLFDGVKANRIRFKRKAQREKKIFSLISNVVGRTEWDSSCSLALNPNRKYYVVNEILREEFYNTCWIPRHEKQSFIIVTTISSGLYKGLETIYRTAEILNKSNIPFLWKVIGISSKDNYTNLTESILELSCLDLNIQLLGRKNASEMVEILLESDVFVQVSHIENSSNSLCEAMLLGMPIVSTFAGGTSSMLKDKIEGILVQEGDSYSLAGTLIKIKNNPDPYIDLAKNARIRAIQRHNPNIVVNELLQTYKTILDDK